MTSAPFDVDAFLARPLVGRVATNGPTVRPVWYLWEDHAFWVLTGPWARLFTRVLADPSLALVVDECDLATGVVRQVIARGRGEFVPFDIPRGRRELVRYLGPDETTTERWRKVTGLCGSGGVPDWSKETLAGAGCPASSEGACLLSSPGLLRCSPRSRGCRGNDAGS